MRLAVPTKAALRPTRLFMLACAGGLALVGGVAHADVKAGVDAWSRGDYAAAVTEWRGPAVAGDADAQFNMGQAYKLGRGVPMDLNAAEDWFRRAAEQGHWQAGDNYGLILFQNNRREEAMPYITASARRGEPRAQYVLGTAYFNGDIVAKDPVQAYAYMTRASALGLPQASKSLATMDQFISLADRQAGISMAAQLEREAASARNQLLAGGPAPAPISPRPSAAPTRPAPPVAVTTAPVAAPMGAPSRGVQTTDLPPSQVAVRPQPVPVPVTAPMAAPPRSSAATAGADFARPQVAAAPPPRATAPAPAPRPVPPAPVAAAITTSAPAGPWRIQLGAFGSMDRAEALWGKLERSRPEMASLQPYLVKAGSVIRLQAGGFASQAEAGRACAKLKPSGQDCIVVKR